MNKAVISALIGLAISVGLFFLVYCLSPTKVDASLLGYRIGYTLKCSIFSLLFFIAIPLFMRLCQCNEETKCLFQGNLETFLVFFVVSLILSYYLGHSTIRMIPAFTAVFCFGRLTYWIGVSLQKGDGELWKKAFGTGINLVLNTGLIIASLVLFFIST